MEQRDQRSHASKSTQDKSSPAGINEQLFNPADILNSVPEAIVATTMESVVLSWNRGAETIYGWAADEVIGKPHHTLLSTRYSDTTHEEVLEHVAAHGSWTGEVAQICKAGQTRRVTLSMSQITDSMDRPVGIAIVSRDIGAPELKTATVDQPVDNPAILINATGVPDQQGVVGASWQLFQSTLNALSSSIAILDETGTIIAVNDSWRRFADENNLRDPAYGVGTNYLTLCDTATGPASEDARFVVNAVRDMLDHDSKGFTFEYACHSPVEKRWFLLNIDSFRVGQMRRIVMAHHDITKRKLAEQKEHRQRLVADVLADIAATINRTLDVDAVLEHILDSVQHIVPHSGANLIFVDTEKNVSRVVRFCACYAKNNLPEPRIGEITAIDAFPLFQMRIDQAQPLAISDVREHPDWVVVPEFEWIRSFASAPIRVEGSVIGFINVDSDMPGAFDMEHAHQLQVLADQAAVAIRNAQLYQELENYSSDLKQAVEERTEQLQRSAEHIESILNSSSDVILLARRKGIIQQANPMFDQWFGSRDSGEVFGRNLSELIAPDQVNLLMETLSKVFDSHQPQRIEIVAQREDGTFSDTDMAIFPIQRRDGDLTTVVCSMRDITERKQTEQTLRHALDREMEVSNMRMRFLSMASHDLRNPLAVVRSGVDMLADYYERLSVEKRAKKFHQIRTSIAHMVELLDDVLTIGRVEAGELTFKPESVECETFCRNIVNEIQAIIGAQHVFNFRMTGEKTTRQLDPKLLRHMLFNLLSNAVKYSPTGSTINFGLDCAPDQTLFRIQDRGIGIPEADLPRLFEAFHRASNVGVIAGTGLGLAIVKQAAELHGGSVTCDTQEGAGTTFTIILPMLKLEEGE